MARIFITGSADGLGLMAAEQLLREGHTVVLHARNPQRAADAHAALPAAEAVLTGDLSTLAAMRELADSANALGAFDAVIHNVAVGYQEPRRIATADGLPHVLAVNTLAPYVLTALMHRPRRLVYLTSGLHRDGDPSLDDLTWEHRRWNGQQAYSDSKLHNLLLAFAVARRWPGVLSNAVTPGWVATKMGGPGATDDLHQGATTQAWLAVSDDPTARVTGQLFYHLQPQLPLPIARDPATQQRLLDHCEQLSGISLPVA